MLVSRAEDTGLLLDASNSGIFMGLHHHVIHLLGVPEREMSRVARGICAIRDDSWVVTARWLRTISSRAVERTPGSTIKCLRAGYRPIQWLKLPLLRGIIHLKVLRYRSWLTGIAGQGWIQRLVVLGLSINSGAPLSPLAIGWTSANTT